MREKYESLSLATLKDSGESKRSERNFNTQEAGADRAYASGG